MPIQARKVDPQNTWMNVLNYGHPGEGKTHLGGTIQGVEGMSNLLFVNAEGGEDTLGNVPQGEDITVIDINDYKEFNEIYEFARAHAHFRDQYEAGNKEAYQKLIKLHATLFGMEEDAVDEPIIFKSIVLDSLTEIQKYAMYMILGIDPKKFKLDEIDKGALIQDWGKNSSLIRKLIRAFRDLKMHTIFNALENRDKDENTGKITILPSLPGKLAMEVSGMVDLVGRITTQKGKDGKLHRILAVQPSGNFVAKDRSNNLGEYLIDPDFEEIYNLYTGRKTRADYPKYVSK